MTKTGPTCLNVLSFSLETCPTAPCSKPLSKWIMEELFIYTFIHLVALYTFMKMSSANALLSRLLSHQRWWHPRKVHRKRNGDLITIILIIILTLILIVIIIIILIILIIIIIININIIILIIIILLISLLSFSLSLFLLLSLLSSSSSSSSSSLLLLLLLLLLSLCSDVSPWVHLGMLMVEVAVYDDAVFRINMYKVEVVAVLNAIRLTSATSIPCIISPRFIE